MVDCNNVVCSVVAISPDVVACSVVTSKVIVSFVVVPCDVLVSLSVVSLVPGVVVVA